jgi:L-alanine-DL-glutamate epimerase-like enolase superfamily enzyme
MRITGCRPITTIQDWGRPVGDANGVFSDGVVTVRLVVVETDAGITGVGLGSHTDLDHIFAAIEGEDALATVALYDRMLRRAFKPGHAGSVFATIGALDSALWDIKAKAAGQPLWRLLGGRDRTLPAYASGLDIALDDEALAAEYQTYAEHGVRAAKLKGGLDVGRDRARLTIVRDVLADAHPGLRPGLMLDANEALTGKQAVRHVAELERSIDLIWVEEPVRRWDADGMVRVGRGVRASIAAGENLTGLEQFRPLIAAGALDVVQTSAVFGVTHFLRVAVLAHAYDLPVSPIGTTSLCLLHAATSVPNHISSELQDLTPPLGLTVDVTVEDGQFVLGDEPGIGIRIDEAVITASTTRPAPTSPRGPHVRPANAGYRLDNDPIR